MNKKNIHLGNTILNRESDAVSGNIVELNGEKFYKIGNYNLMPDFFMTIVSDSNHWMYLSSNGSLTAGRKNRDNSLFPYYTVDKIHDYKNITGSKTICLIEKNSKTFLWEPFVDEYEKIYRIERNLYKSIYGNKIIFEERNIDLELSFQYGWYNSEKFGWIKKSVLANNSNGSIKTDLIDGISNILPYGIDYSLQNEYSNLSDAYKKNELLKDSKLGLYTLSSIPVDRPEPSEALKATTVWSIIPYTCSKYLISNKQLEYFKTGRDVELETDVFATRGAYYINSEHSLEQYETISWYIVAEVNQDSTDVANLDRLIKSNENLAQKLEDDIAIGTSNLIQIVAKADGLQLGIDELVCARHFSNTLFNVMRGGIIASNYQVDTSDFELFVNQCNKEVREQFKEVLHQLPDVIGYNDLLLWSGKFNNTDLERICFEYLPLTFSRRHGDPSRPWNQFSIETKNEDGSEKLSYQGNWRDIFQNWEALSLSFPVYIESMLCRFVNATTADGYNPYRITRKGIDWECPDPNDKWAYIGYWNDHQIIYLQKILEQSDNFHPGKLNDLLLKDIFVYANVPYRIKSFEDIIQNPKDTIVFDWELNNRIQESARNTGADGKLLYSKEGEIYKVNLLEKVLCTLLSKLCNFIPEAGIWMNTQRPEWNDANNALVGNGASMVTLYYLRRFLSFWKKKFKSTTIDRFEISEEVLRMFDEIFTLFAENKGQIQKGFSDKDRYNFTHSLGNAGSNYRQSIYSNLFSGKKGFVSISNLTEFVDLSLRYIDHTIGKNRRADGLYHSYNLISFSEEEVTIRPLYEMLEGQVAVLSSGFLNTNECLEVLDAMKESRLFREDQYSYLLYPARVLPRFVEKNIIPEQELSKSGLLKQLIGKKNSTIVQEDETGKCHFNGSFRNVTDLSEALDRLDNKIFAGMVRKEKKLILEIFESVFDHQTFTGRSGTFYGYEGIGSIYWHMVSKLLLATQECYSKGTYYGADAVILGKLKDHYYELKAGIGIYKSPRLYGAFPTDAYSHTPANSGAKQPGLTGQVKEDIISRFGEFGVHIQGGKIIFSPLLLNHNEILQDESTFNYIDLDGNNRSIDLKVNQLAFTYCQVPVIYTLNQKELLTIEFNSGAQKVIADCTIDEDTSHKIFSRSGDVRKIEYSFEL